jgi:branched-chain amino acid transport system permease protein
VRGAIGVLMEFVLLRRIYRAPELFQLLATFGVVLVVEDAVRWLWGPEDLLSPRARAFRGTVEILGQRFPQYHLLLMGLGRWCGWVCGSVPSHALGHAGACEPRKDRE